MEMEIKKRKIAVFKTAKTTAATSDFLFLIICFLLPSGK